MKNLFWGPAIVIVIAGLITSCKRNSSASRYGRIFNQIEFIDSLFLDLPIYRIQYDHGHVFGYYFPDKSIYKLNEKFEILDSLGRWGDGPKENLMIRNYQVIHENKLKIFDSEKNSFKIQDFKDSVYFFHKFSKNLYGGFHLDDQRFLIWSKANKSRIEFNYYDLNQNQYYPINNINSYFDSDNSALVYEGKVLLNGNEVLYTSYFANFWFKYNINSDEISIGKYIHDYPLPKVLEVGDGVMLDDAVELIVDSFIYKEKLMIISNFGERKFPEQRILDIYDIMSMQYEKSYLLPKLFETAPDEGFLFKDGQIGILYEDLVAIFKLKN
ncbi:hypothetical protein [Mongoliitalea daihaiensis]|uniref:hypothetical protein n=1 Tax=Mongoliitalea daihaiensis TaxID=2782006 RepID=UPI001F2CCA9A|nr:hypothetical protein [Mongoliitalea daihaiensis]UJP65456.1 hypothetical protein IPZ59_02185 [Mongoliitalea daihaiensis]